MTSHHYSSDDVQLKYRTGIIDGSQGFSRCAQFLLSTKIGGATAIQKLLVK